MNGASVESRFGLSTCPRQRREPANFPEKAFADRHMVERAGIGLNDRANDCLAGTAFAAILIGAARPGAPGQAAPFTAS
jgi:hypothetical protein